MICLWHDRYHTHSKGVVFRGAGPHHRSVCLSVSPSITLFMSLKEMKCHIFHSDILRFLMHQAKDPHHCGLLGNENSQNVQTDADKQAPDTEMGCGHMVLVQWQAL